MAKGAEAKAEIGSAILELFSDAFWYNGGKEIRVNTTENGEPCQIKIAMTCAKVAVSAGDEDALPTPKPTAKTTVNTGEFSFPDGPAKKVEATTEEKDALADLMSELGL